jgi:DNA repair exonuclease SbcCD ATPase subunit
MDLPYPFLTIDRIVLNNFGMFLGKIQFVLGCSPEKHVTFITGPFGSGKTTILDAIRWIFNPIDQNSSAHDPSFLIRNSSNL